MHNNRAVTLIEMMIILVLVCLLSVSIIAIITDKTKPTEPSTPQKILISDSWDYESEKANMQYNGMAGQIFSLSAERNSAVNNWYSTSKKKIYFRGTYFDVLEVTPDYIILRVSKDQRTE